MKRTKPVATIDQPTVKKPKPTENKDAELDQFDEADADEAPDFSEEGSPEPDGTKENSTKQEIPSNDQEDQSNEKYPRL